MVNHRPIAVCLAALLAASVAAPLFAAESDSWPTFRGPERTGVSPDTGLLKSWPEDGPKLLWEAEGAGRGYSSVAIAGGRIYTLGDGPSTADDKDEYLTCFELDGGKQLWKTKTGEAWNSGQESWQGSRSTPTVDGDRVYVITPHGKLFCCDTAGGDVKWSKDLKQAFGGKKGDGWGYSESPLVDGDLCVCTPGGSSATMVALNKLTGEKVWQTDWDNSRGAGHASIVVSRAGGRKVYVQTTASGALGVNAEDGKLLWTYDFPRITAVIPTPIVRDDLVFVGAGYGTGGGALLKQVASGSDEVRIEEIYPLNGDLKNKHGGIVLVGDYLYADSDDRGTPYCAELMTGNIKWRERGPGRNSAAITAADGCLYVRFADGTMALIEANPSERKILGSFKIPGSGERPSWAHPVVAEGKLFLREGDRILCYDLKG
ncbi:MAG: PQQ-like beta-propeller repeat protein [Pirellulaceae bacterium]|nr:PQQ-like beta-propeller repeat protein [Pirellulaceae bacterium]